MKKDQGKKPLTRGRVSARKVLGEAMKFVGKDVIVLGVDRGGEFYRATSMPNKSTADYDAILKLLNEAMKRTKRNRRDAEQRELDAAAQKALAPA